MKEFFNILAGFILILFSLGVPIGIIVIFYKLDKRSRNHYFSELYESLFNGNSQAWGNIRKWTVNSIKSEYRLGRHRFFQEYNLSIWARENDLHDFSEMVEDGFSPLMIAVSKNNNIEVVKDILLFSDPGYKNEKGLSAYSIAKENDNENILSLLKHRTDAILEEGTVSGRLSKLTETIIIVSVLLIVSLCELIILPDLAKTIGWNKISLGLLIGVVVSPIVILLSIYLFFSGSHYIVYSTTTSTSKRKKLLSSSSGMEALREFIEIVNLKIFLIVSMGLGIILGPILFSWWINR